MVFSVFSSTTYNDHLSVLFSRLQVKYKGLGVLEISNEFFFEKEIEIFPHVNEKRLMLIDIRNSKQKDKSNLIYIKAPKI